MDNLNPSWISQRKPGRSGSWFHRWTTLPVRGPVKRERLPYWLSENGAFSAGKAQKNGIPTGKIYEKHGEMMIRYQILGEKNYFDKPDMIQYA
jgi:hypothetical protein